MTTCCGSESLALSLGSGSACAGSPWAVLVAVVTTGLGDETWFCSRVRRDDVAVAESMPSVRYSLDASPLAEVGVVTFVRAAVEVRYPSRRDEQICRVNDLAFGLAFGEGVCTVSPI